MAVKVTDNTGHKQLVPNTKETNARIKSLAVTKENIRVSQATITVTDDPLKNSVENPKQVVTGLRVIGGAADSNEATVRVYGSDVKDGAHLQSDAKFETSGGIDLSVTLGGDDVTIDGSRLIKRSDIRTSGVGDIRQVLTAVVPVPGDADDEIKIIQFASDVDSAGTHGNGASPGTGDTELSVTLKATDGLKAKIDKIGDGATMSISGKNLIQKAAIKTSGNGLPLVVTSIVPMGYDVDTNTIEVKQFTSDISTGEGHGDKDTKGANDYEASIFFKGQDGVKLGLSSDAAGGHIVVKTPDLVQGIEHAQPNRDDGLDITRDGQTVKLDAYKLLKKDVFIDNEVMTSVTVTGIDKTANEATITAFFRGVDDAPSAPSRPAQMTLKVSGGLRLDGHPYSSTNQSPDIVIDGQDIVTNATQAVTAAITPINQLLANLGEEIRAHATAISSFNERLERAEDPEIAPISGSRAASLIGQLESFESSNPTSPNTYGAILYAYVDKTTHAIKYGWGPGTPVNQSNIS
jgi:hypothetical protein